MSSQLDIFPRMVDFGNVYVGSQSSRTINIYNIGEDPVGKVKIDFSRTMDFHIRHNCIGELRPRQSCFVDIRFTPRYEGFISDYIFIGSQGQPGQSAILIRGRGVRSSAN